MTNITYPAGNVTSFTDFVTWMNDGALSGLFFVGVLMAMFFIIIIKMIANGASIPRALAATSFICFVMSVMLRTIDLIGTPSVITFLVLTAIAAIMMHFENSGRVT